MTGNENATQVLGVLGLDALDEIHVGVFRLRGPESKLFSEGHERGELLLVKLVELLLSSPVGREITVTTGERLVKLIPGAKVLSLDNPFLEAMHVLKRSAF